MVERQRVLIANDQAIMRARLKSWLCVSTELEIVGEAVDAQEAVRMAGTLKPDLLLMDFSMRYSNGTQVIRAIKSRYPEIHIIVLAVGRSGEYVQAAQDAGADGFVLKDDDAGESLTAIQLAAWVAAGGLQGANPLELPLEKILASRHTPVASV